MKSKVEALNENSLLDSNKNIFEKIKDAVGLPCLIIAGFFIVLLILAATQRMNLLVLFGEILRRWGMNGILVLAMVPSILCGIGLNFGISLGILSGLFGSLISIELKLIERPMFQNSPGLAAIASFLVAVVVSIVVSVIIGSFYGMLLNKLKGSEMTVSTYVGFSSVALMNIVWLILPFRNGDSIWPVAGEGLRNTINLGGYFGSILNDFLGFHIGGQKLLENGVDYTKNIITFAAEKEQINFEFAFKNSMFVPTGLLLFFAFSCLVVWLFLKTKTGMGMSAAGANPSYAKSSGINTDKMRILGTILSTVLGSIGIIVYSQSYGFIQIYNAPLMMGFACVAAVLIGGATVKKVKISNVVVGTFLFQGVLTVSLPVANKLMPESNLTGIIGSVISNGIILYALTRAGGTKTDEE